MKLMKSWAYDVYVCMCMCICVCVYMCACACACVYVNAANPTGVCKPHPPLFPCFIR